MFEVSIVIPIYKKTPNDFEIISLRQVFKILGNKYKIIIVCPDGLDISYYESIAEKYPLKGLQAQRFSKSYFLNIQSYNKLMLSISFYEKFIKYDYILIYQLDCYVFRDDLEYWCKQGYDYIGAPFLDYKFYNLTRINKVKFLIKQFINKKIGREITLDSILYKVGNGGFSLRRVNKFCKLLKSVSDKRKERYMSILSSDLRNEDTFFTYEVNKYCDKLKIPNYKVGLKFSLDWNPQIGIAMNKGEPPFGCHGWDRKLEFWKKYIDL